MNEEPIETTALAVTPTPEGEVGRLLSMVEEITRRGGPDAVGTIERLQAMWERARDDARNAALVSALVDFQSEVPPIPRTKDGLHGKYADLDQIERTIRPYLKRNRLAFRWTSEPDAKGATFFCHIMHADGAERVSKQWFPMDEGNRGQKPYLAAGGVGTFGKRQTLIEVLGLTTCDEDAAPPYEMIDDSMAADLRALMEEVGETEERICRIGKLERLEDLTVPRYQNLVAGLERRRK